MKLVVEGDALPESLFITKVTVIFRIIEEWCPRVSGVYKPRWIYSDNSGHAVLSRGASLPVVSLAGLRLDVQLSRFGGNERDVGVYVCPQLDVRWGRARGSDCERDERQNQMSRHSSLIQSHPSRAGAA